MIICFIGTTELLLIGGLALLLVGGKKLPEMMRGLGKGVREFKEGMSGVPEANADSHETEEDSKQSDLESPKPKDSNTTDK